jgi:hypothetical protein
LAGSLLLDVDEGLTGGGNRRIKFFRGSLKVLGRVSGKVGQNLWFFCGEDVVECVVNVVRKPRCFDSGKIRHKFHVFLVSLKNGTSGCEKAYCFLTDGGVRCG